MLFNVDRPKCKVTHLGYKNPQADYVMKVTQLQGIGTERLGSGK